MVFEIHYESLQHQQPKQMATSYKIYEAVSRSKENLTTIFPLTSTPEAY